MGGLNRDSALRIAHVGLYVLTFTAGLMTCLGLGWATKILNQNCLLYSTMHLTKAPNDTIQLDVIQSHWGAPSICSYCIYSCSCIVSYAIIWFWFYLLLSDWKEKPMVIEDTNKGAPPDSRLLIPTLLFNIISWVVCIVSLGLLSIGRVQWCNSVMRSLRKECDYLSHTTWSNLEHGHHVYDYVLIALIGNWLLFGAVSAKTGICVARLYHYLTSDYEHPARENTKKNRQLESSGRLDLYSISRGASPSGKQLHVTQTAEKGPLLADNSSDEGSFTPKDQQNANESTFQNPNYQTQSDVSEDSEDSEDSDSDDNDDVDDDANHKADNKAEVP